jgi:hypothetical protein
MCLRFNFGSQFRVSILHFAKKVKVNALYCAAACMLPQGRPLIEAVVASTVSNVTSILYILYSVHITYDLQTSNLGLFYEQTERGRD